MMTSRHGPEHSNDKVASNLPWLEAYYEPGMYISSIAALNDVILGGISGLQVELRLDGEEEPILPPIVGVAAEEVEEWDL